MRSRICCRLPPPWIRARTALTREAEEEDWKLTEGATAAAPRRRIKPLLAELRRHLLPSMLPIRTMPKTLPD